MHNPGVLFFKQPTYAGFDMTSVSCYINRIDTHLFAI